MYINSPPIPTPGMDETPNRISQSHHNTQHIRHWISCPAVSTCSVAPHSMIKIATTLISIVLKVTVYNQLHGFKVLRGLSHNLDGVMKENKCQGIVLIYS